MKFSLNRDWQRLLADHGAVKDGSKRLAEAIAEDARERTEVGTTGRARDSIEVVEDDGAMYVVGGTGDGWYFLFQETGGRGFRPPPMPIRRAASKYGRR